MNRFESTRVDSVVIFNIFDIVFFCFIKIKPDDLPIKFSLIKQTQRPKYLYSFGLPHPHYLVHTNLDDIDRVVVSVCPRLTILVLTVLPGLRKHSIIEHRVEHVVTQVLFSSLLIFLYILLHWVILFICGDLHFGCRVSIFNQWNQNKYFDISKKATKWSVSLPLSLRGKSCQGDNFCRDASFSR